MWPTFDPCAPSWIRARSSPKEWTSFVKEEHDRLHPPSQSKSKRKSHLTPLTPIHQLVPHAPYQPKRQPRRRRSNRSLQCYSLPRCDKVTGLSQQGKGMMRSEFFPLRPNRAKKPEKKTKKSSSGSSGAPTGAPPSPPPGGAAAHRGNHE